MGWIKITMDNENWLRTQALYEQAGQAMEQSMYFVGGQISSQLTRLLPTASLLLGKRAGAGFPSSYNNHLALTIAEKVRPLVNNIGAGILEVTIGFENLGGWNELELGYHQGAMEAGSLDMADFKSFRINTKPDLPGSQVQLPYGGQELANDKQRRLDYWENAIVERISSETNVWANWSRKKPQDLWHVPWSDVPTFEQVANRRVKEAWEPLGVAPEWVLLEDGMVLYKPYINPVGYLFLMNEVCKCVFDQLVSAVLEQVAALLSQGAEFTQPFVSGGNTKSLPFSRTPAGPRFTSPTPLPELSAPDTAGCLSLLV